PDTEVGAPVWLEVDVDGVALYADLWELREVTEAGVSDAGFWWGNWTPDPESAPALLKPYLDARGVVTYEALLDEAAAAAIEVTRSAALLEPLPAKRIEEPR